MILMYHKVFPESPSMWWVAVDEFYRHLVELEHKKFVYLDEYDPENADHVVVTFDGIYRNVLQYAAPVLNHLKIPFELFLTSDYIGQDNLFDTPEPAASFATEGELQKLVSLGGRLQWHTRSHPNMKELRDAITIERELTIPENVRSLDPNGFSWFAYPYGEFSDEVVAAVKPRFRGAVSCIQGNDRDPFVLNRVTAVNESRFQKASIGVIIPSYNYGRFLVEAIESVLRQSRAPNEILILDDCSSDDTPLIAEEYARRHPHLIRFVRNEENLGIVANFNKGVAIMQSDYVCFLGADNRFRSDYLERTARVLDAQDDVAVAYTDYALFGPRAVIEHSAFPDAMKGPVKEHTFFTITFPEFTEQTRAELKVRNFIHGSSLYRRAVFNEVGGYKEKASSPEDHNLFLRMVDAGWSAVRVPHPVLEYRQHSFDQANQRFVSFMQLNFYRDQLQQREGTISELSGNVDRFRSEVNNLTNQLENLSVNVSDRETVLSNLLAEQRSLQEDLVRLREAVSKNQAVPAAGAESAFEEAIEIERGALRERVVQLELQLQQIVGSAKWRVFSKIVGAAQKATPPGTRRHRLMHSLLQHGKDRLRRKKPETPIFSETQRFVPCVSGLCRKSQMARVKFGWSGANSPAFPLPLLPGTNCVVRLEAPGDELSEIHLLFATYDRNNTCKVRLQLRESGKPHFLADTLIDAAAIQNNSYFEWRFEAIADSGGKRFEVLVSSPDSGPDNNVAIWGSLLEESSEEYQNLLSRGALREVAPGIVIGRETLGSVVDAALIHDPNTESVFVPCYLSLCSLDAVSKVKFGWEGNQFERVPLPIEEQGVRITFDCPTDSIEEVSFLLATYCRKNSCHLIFSLRDLSEGSDGSVIRYRKISSLYLEDNSYASFPFEPIENARGKRFEVSLVSLDASPQNRVACWGNLVRRDSDTYRDLERNEAGDFISFRDTYRAFLDVSSTKRIVGQFPEKFTARGQLQRLTVLFVVDDSADVSSGIVSQCAEVFRAAGMNFSVIFSRRILEAQRDILSFDIVVFHQVRWSDQMHDLLRLLRRSHRMTVGTADSYSVFPDLIARQPFYGALSQEEQSELREKARFLQTTISNCDFVLSTSDVLRAHGQALGIPAFLLRDQSGLPHDVQVEKLHDLIESMVAEYRRHHFPSFSIVSVLYGKERELPYFMESIRRQSYAGEIELILVDDQTPDRSVEAAEEQRIAFESSGGRKGKRTLRVIRNTENRGNCGSRNAALEVASGDIVIVIDADCLLNRNFIQAHANAYLAQDCDVAVGYFNLETGEQEPIAALQALEVDSELVTRAAQLQDPVNTSSFLNCITRNFSIRRSFITEALFDELFSYSKKADSGFGWEDVEMGFRLYQRGARIKFVPEAFSVHVSHPSAVEEKTKPLRSLLNFRRLIEKHPDMVLIARKWVTETFEKICHWADSHELPANDDRKYVEHCLKRYRDSVPRVQRKRPYRVLTYRWHCPHQYEIYKAGHQYTLLKGVGTPFTDRWYYEHRPVPSNASFKFVEEVDLNSFDFAILHFDENVLAPERTNGVLEREWGNNFKWFRENVKVPCVAVCHGTPQFYGQYNANYAEPNLLEVIEEERQRLVDYVGDMLVVCNSYQAQREWGFRNSRVIWHGFDPAEYPLSTYRKGVLSLGKTMKERPHYRGYRLYQETMKYLGDMVEPAGPAVKSPSVLYLHETNEYAWAKYRNYVDDIRAYSVYFNPTIRSPMPRSRAEAMLCGLVSVSANNHDVEFFIKNGVNGFYSNDPQELADYLLFLHRHPDSTRRMGLESRKLATDIFNHDRFLAEWEKMARDLVG